MTSEKQAEALRLAAMLSEVMELREVSDSRYAELGRKSYQRALQELGAERRIAAAKAARAHKSVRGDLGEAWSDPKDRRRFVERVAKESDVMRQKMSLAARNATQLTDEDILEILRDLHSLGALPSSPKFE